MTTTQRLLDQLNAARGVTYPDAGYRTWADIRGDGTYRPAIWVCLKTGGVSYCYELNATSARKRCDKIRAAIDAANKERHGVVLCDPTRPIFPTEKESDNV